MDVDIDRPHVSHHRSGNRWLDLGLPLGALFVSFVSIAIAWHHGRVMQQLVRQNERLVEANSLPYLQISGSDSGKTGVTLNATNEGVGPAKIMTAEILVDGRPVETLAQLMDACCGTGDQSAVSVSSLEGRMVRPGDAVAYLDVRAVGSGTARLAALDRARQSNRIVTRLCYCSVFDDCWMADSRDPTPDAVKRCVPPPHPYRE
jgi:hypothetical protein